MGVRESRSDCGAFFVLIWGVHGGRWTWWGNAAFAARCTVFAAVFAGEIPPEDDPVAGGTLWREVMHFQIRHVATYQSAGLRGFLLLSQFRLQRRDLLLRIVHCQPRLAMFVPEPLVLVLKPCQLITQLLSTVWATGQWVADPHAGLGPH